jgi:hypothetical protein
LLETFYSYKFGASGWLAGAEALTSGNSFKACPTRWIVGYGAYMYIQKVKDRVWLRLNSELTTDTLKKISYSSFWSLLLQRESTYAPITRGFICTVAL